jgi:predicted RNA-binding protein with RPS1 domain
VIEGEIKSITEFGLFIGLDSDIDGMVHLSDLSWTAPGEEALKTYEKGQVVKAKVLDIDVEKERVSLGIKQLESDPIEKAGPSGGALRKGSVVTGTVTEVNDGGIEVELEGGVRSSSAVPTWPATATTSAPNASARATRWTRWSPVWTRPAARSRCPSRPAKSRKRRKPWQQYRLVRQRRQPGRYPGRGLEEEDAQEEGRRRVIVRP